MCTEISLSSFTLYFCHVYEQETRIHYEFLIKLWFMHQAACAKHEFVPQLWAIFNFMCILG